MANYEGWTNERLDTILRESGNRIQRLGMVEFWDTRIKFRCLECGNEWYTTPYNIKQGTGCPVCWRNIQKGGNRKPKYTYKEVVEFLNVLGYDLVDEVYENAVTPMTVKCRDCGETFTRTLSSFKRGYNRCPICKKRVKKVS